MNLPIKLAIIRVVTTIAVAVMLSLDIAGPALRSKPQAVGFEEIVTNMQQTATEACRCETSDRSSNNDGCWKTYGLIMGAFEHVQSEVRTQNISVQSDCLGLVRNREPCIALRYRVVREPSASIPFVCTMDEARAVQTANEGRSKRR